MNVGDKVYVIQHGSWSATYYPGHIVKVTPSGLIDVSIGGSAPIRFRNGQELGGSRYYGKSLDTKPYAEREMLLAQEERAKAAASAINAIKLEQCVKYTWGKEELARSIDQLQQLCDKARKAVEAI